MATQGKKETGKKNVLTGDPITVGGGGGKKHKKGRITTFNPMYITFADAVYPDPDPNGPEKEKDLHSPISGIHEVLNVANWREEHRP